MLHNISMHMVIVDTIMQLETQVRQSEEQLKEKQASEVGLPTMLFSGSSSPAEIGSLSI